ncbi:hypothetical protein AGMMS49992_32550 [Clostridia bacterium]|nr:hypothetical protein AGMMS49992_32550 [Clostridia bacterium]
MITLVEVVVIVFSAVHDPQDELLEDSAYSISYDDMVLSVPSLAPDHDRVGSLSAIVGEIEVLVGAPQAVGAVHVIAIVTGYADNIENI